MARIDFPLGISGLENLPRTRRDLVNVFNNQNGAIIPRPGITQLNTNNGVARGQFVFDGKLYIVASQQLLQVTNTSTGSWKVIGTIAGNATVATASGFTEAVIVVRGGDIYTLDTSENLTNITGNANFVACNEVTYIDGRFIYVPTSGDPVFFSDVNDAGAVQATSFFDAETLPDKNNNAFDFKGTLYVMGTDSIELFRNTASEPVPFTRLTGAQIDNGYIGGLVKYNETFMFIGREQNQDYGIYAIGQGLAPKVSNEAIDLLLSEYTIDELGDAYGGRFKWRGYDIAFFTLKRDSIAFYGGQWFRLTATSDGDQGPWEAGFVTQFEGAYFTAFDNRIGNLDDVNTDYGGLVTRIIDAGYEDENNDYFGGQSVEVGLSQGYNDGVATVGLALSRNNVEYGEYFFRDLGDVANYTDHLEWNYPGGLGRYDGFMGLRLYTTQNLFFSTNSLVINFND